MTENAGRAPEPDEDAVWRSIVENYGDRPQLAEPEPKHDPESLRKLFEPLPRPVEDTDRFEEDEHFVPPEPPKFEPPRGPRLAAWLGIIGPPTVMLLCVVFRFSLPSPFPFFLFLAFIGGFGYLVATMRKDNDDDGWDNGAVL